MLPADGFTLVAPGCNIVARPAEVLAAVPVFAWWVVVGDSLAPGTPAVLDAVDGLAPLAVTKGRSPAPLLLAPGTPAVVDAFDGLAPPPLTTRHPPSPSDLLPKEFRAAARSTVQSHNPLPPQVARLFTPHTTRGPLWPLLGP